DHKFHQAIARAARNRYLAATLERYFGLSQRLWYLVLPQLDFLPTAVQEHLDLIDALRAGDADVAEQIMREHVQMFYDQVRAILIDEGKAGDTPVKG
ncbi:MAG: FCD domain-containing protein, partial [Anaerolineales bacterium]|nr:FCD domain-containing protein [Anaerolineales bacterium]